MILITARSWVRVARAPSWTRKNRKVTDLLDRNTYPVDGFLLGKEVNPEPVHAHTSLDREEAGAP